ncbi:MAG TPA: imidazole glycerol phosphate synthase subunit HisH, partial [Burkholderiales bacterium]|nr:imidazole glycerol phosphate synthase subunit HisH [Burkholderiales bacterium]
DPAAVARAARVVFPGQGAMPDCIRELDARGLRGAVLDAASGKPFLGICIGLQMLFDRSEEGDTPGLGLLPGRVRRFPAQGMVDAQGARLKVPHMGWNEVRQTAAHALWDGIPQGERFYFVHSYFPEPASRGVTAGEAVYGVPFACAAARDNVFAVQFHPEKSNTAGLRLLANFLAWQPAAPNPRQRTAATPAA